MADEEGLELRSNDLALASAMRHMIGLTCVTSALLTRCTAELGLLVFSCTVHYESLLLIANWCRLVEGNPQNAAKLLHVAQLEHLEVVVKTLFLHHNVDELLLAVDANAKLGCVV